MQDKLSRMKAMMAYGLQTENKNCQYCSVEQSKVAADGKMYGVVREGVKYYLKVSEKTQNPLKEDFDYIGGFRNRKNHEYDSCAKAMKQLELKLMSINEAYGKHNGIIIESWDPSKKEQLSVESTEKMRREINRQREIMGNAKQIHENKGSYCKVTGDCGATQKNNIKKTSDGKGEPTGNGGDPFTEKVDAEQGATQKNNVKKEFKPVMEAENVLGWNDNADYMDTTHGTEIGDSAPFDVEVVEECDALHNCDGQNNPKPGTNKVGNSAPFDEKPQMHESSFFHNDEEADEDQLEDTPEEIIIDDADLEELPFGDDEFGAEEGMDDVEPMDDVEEFEDEPTFDNDEEFEVEDDVEDIEEPAMEENEFNSRLDAIESMIAKIAEKLHIDEFEEDDLYPESDEEGKDEEVDAEYEFEFDADEDGDVEDEEGEEVEEETFTEGKFIDTIKTGYNKFKKAMEAPTTKNPLCSEVHPDWDEEDEDDYDLEESLRGVKVIESRSFRKMMRESDFGKHPAYRKEVMTLPSNQNIHNPGYYDMNDESVEGEQPYGQEIGDGAPFNIDVDSIDNAVAESINRILGKRKNL